MDNSQPYSKTAQVLALVVGSTIVWSGINPAFHAVWVAEIVPVALAFVLLVLTHKRFTFSNTAYIFMSVWLFMHAIGAHYTFANVPFDWFNDAIGSERNHYDRIAHYSIGFYAFPIAEYLVRKEHCKPVLAAIFGLFAIIVADREV
ncbi:DUF2238 domain-containing protein [Photobacterium nomapromontoriensis]|uniref:DUF2238 domain-containing protein n=1 Tax=Photobacterium nomapromontoriensis TaxID=2910237 RepID=UPI003D112280